MLPYDRKNRLPFPLFEAVAGLWYAPDYLTIGNWSSKRIETLVSILLVPQLRVSTHSAIFSNQNTQIHAKKEPLYSDSFLFDMRGLIT